MKQERKNRDVPRLCLNGARLLAAALFAGLFLIASGCGSTGEEGGYQYRITRGTAEITAYTGVGVTMDVPMSVGDLNVVRSVAPGAIPDHVIALSLPSTCTVSAAALEQAENLRYLFLDAEAEAPPLPDGCELLRWGEEYKDGISILDYHVDDAGVLYALLDDGTAVLLSIPAGVREYEVEMVVGSGQGVIREIDGAALDEAEDLVSLTLGSLQGFPPEMLDQLLALDQFSYPDDTYTSDYILTAKAVNRINAEREEQGLDPIRPDRQMIEAARVRKRELGEKYSFDRPDISGGWTAMTDAGVTYQMAKQYRWHGADRAEMEEELLRAVVEDVLAEEQLFYDRIGLSSGFGPYSEEEPYVTYGFLVDSTTTRLTFSGVEYEVEADSLRPVSVMDGARFLGLYRELYCKPLGDLPDGFFDGAGDLRAVYLDLLSPHADQIPDDYLVVREGTDVGDGEASGLYVDGEGSTYILTDRGRCVLWDIPTNLTDVVVSAQISGSPVTYIAPRAVKGIRELDSLYISDLCGFPPDSFDWYEDHVSGIFSSETIEFLAMDSEEFRNSLFSSIVFTDLLRTRINEERDGILEYADASYELLCAAKILAREQPELFGTTRPDGSSWSTALDEAYVEDWESGLILVKRCVELTEVATYLDEVVEEFVFAQKDYVPYRNVAFAIQQSGTDVYVVALATLS